MNPDNKNIKDQPRQGGQQQPQRDKERQGGQIPGREPGHQGGNYEKDKNR